MLTRGPLGIIFIFVLITPGMIACSGGGDTGTNIISVEQPDTIPRTVTTSDYEIEGTISSIVDSQSFYLGNVLVTHDSSTRFEYGDADDLAVGRRVEVEGTITSSGTVTAREIEFKNENYDDDYEDNYEIEGTITSIVNSESFYLGSVLVTYDSSTRFEYGSASDLAIGRRVEVEGSRENSGTVTAREIEFEYDDGNYEIEGTITSIVNSESFYLGSVLVTYDSSTRFEYGSASDLAIGRRVEVEGSRENSGTVTAREIEFEYDDGNYEIEGTITSIVNSESFYLGSVLVTHDSSTRFEYGSASDLAVGRRVEVEGSRESSGTVTAREIEFEDNDNDDHDDDDDDYEIEGTITSIVDSQSFYLGSTLVRHNSSTRFEDGSVSDLAVGKRVEVEGTRTSSGTVIAREIEFEDDD